METELIQNPISQKISNIEVQDSELPDNDEAKFSSV